MKAAWLAAMVAIAGTARADDLWKQAADPDLQRGKYNAAMSDASDYLLAANARDLVDSRIEANVQKAIAAYRKAAELEPREAEPLYELGEVIYEFYLVCYGNSRATSPLCNANKPMPVARAEQTLAAWAEFERREPLDPRNSVAGDSGDELLFTRALLETRLATKPHLEAASQLYEKILARSEVSFPSEQVIANLAETYMMLDRLDDAIATYRRASGQDPSTGYGLAVALDRDGRGDEALAIVHDQGDPTSYFANVRDHNVFYVPFGEEYYYDALIEEAFGDREKAIEYWERYIQSGAHPEFQPRARQHLDALRAQTKNQPKPWPRRPAPELPL